MSLLLGGDDCLDEERFKPVHRRSYGTVGLLVLHDLFYPLDGCIADGAGSNLPFVCLLQELLYFSFCLDFPAVENCNSVTYVFDVSEEVTAKQNCFSAFGKLKD